MTPSVSILLPVRNAERTLSESLASLQRQTHADWECILIDDASTDRSAVIGQRFAESDPRIRLLRRPKQGGIVRALQQAADEARAPILARQDADDLSHPDRFAQSLALLRSSDRLGAVGCRVRLFPDETLPPGWVAYGEWLNGLVTPDDIAREIYVESPLPHPSVMMRRDAFDGCGGYRDPGWPEDYDLWLRMHAAGWAFAKPERVLYDWRHREGRLTHQDPRYAPDAFLACKIHHLAPRLARAEVLIWGAGRDGRRLARALKTRGFSVAAFIDIDPRKIGGKRHGRPILSPRRLGARQDWLRVAKAAADRCGSDRPDGTARTDARPPDGTAWTDARPPDGMAWTDAPPLILVAVGTKGARQLIRRQLRGTGWTEGDDFVCLH